MAFTIHFHDGIEGESYNGISKQESGADCKERTVRHKAATLYSFKAIIYTSYFLKVIEHQKCSLEYIGEYSNRNMG